MAMEVQGIVTHSHAHTQHNMHAHMHAHNTQCAHKSKYVAQLLPPVPVNCFLLFHSSGDNTGKPQTEPPQVFYVVVVCSHFI